MIVVADTTPLNYLMLIGEIELLPQLFGRVLIPFAVFEELNQAETPGAVRNWMANPPPWLEVRILRSRPADALDYLDQGEREAIALAEETHADRSLIDETEARREAARRNLPFIGKLGVLREGARRGLLDLPSMQARLQATSF